MATYTPEQLSYFRSLFKGRDDVFATRWEKGEKSGYMPTYSFDPYHYRAHKVKGGTFQNYPDKSFVPLTDDLLIQHLNGDHFMGIYPLLQDNRSWFIVADFDEGNWAASARKFINTCLENKTQAYLERSRSGNGGHVWIFFDAPIPAIESRKIVSSLLISAGAVSAFDKNSGFDRLFPNQDYHSGKGLGNLIALPLNGRALQKGNTCFIDPETLLPYTDQWAFIRLIGKVNSNKFLELSSSKGLNDIETIQHTGKLIIVLKNDIRLNKNCIPPLLFSYLKEELNFPNNEFIIRKKSGRSTFGIDRFFRLIEEYEGNVHLPKGFIGKLIRFCRDRQLDYDFSDERVQLPPVLFSFQAMLHPYQEKALSAITRKDIGVVVAPPGSGKTVLALKLISDKQQPTLAVVHRKQLAAQWIERIESFLGIPQREIGQIGQGKTKIGKQITVATIQSLAKTDLSDLSSAFGLVIVDECHHIPAETFRKTIAKFNSRYLYGFTATPFRKYNDDKLIFIHLGDVITEIRNESLPTSHLPNIIIRNTELDVPFNGKTDRFETLSRIVIHDSARNQLILNDVSSEAKRGRRCIILTERKEHIDTLEQYLKQSFETIALSGSDVESARIAKWEQLAKGDYQILITSGQFFGEGSDLPNAQCLFLVYPFSFEGKLVQYIGRVQRSGVPPTVYGYRDIKIDYLNKMFLKRNVYYRKLEKQRTLFDFPTEEENNKTEELNETIIEKLIKVRISDLEFLYGSVQFQWKATEFLANLTFDIEQASIRPEFEVLKPYFEKFLSSKTVSVAITIVTSHVNQVVALSAKSIDIERLYQEAVESVRFRFVKRNFLNASSSQGTLDSGTVVMQTSTKGLYETGEEMLSDVLARGSFRHQKELQYLAEKHQGGILKIRFTFSPFSFAFLVEGKEHYHLIFETVDTDEATYLWHLPKNKKVLRVEIPQIDVQLQQIQAEGRQKFLESNPLNFSRILHDYSDETFGFSAWKKHLEERLF